jgi:hypothetical protein
VPQNCEKCGLIVTTGVEGSSTVEGKLNRGLEENTMDVLHKTEDLPQLDSRTLITNSDRLLNTAKSRYPDLNTRESGADFHFGKSFYRTIEQLDLKEVLYVGGGSATLLGSEEFSGLVEFLRTHEESSISNNFYSADLLGCTPTNRLLEETTPPEKDNELGWLTREVNLTPYELERGASTQLDIDSPVDLLPLKLSEQTGPRLSDYVDTLDWGQTRFKEILPQFTDQNSRIVIYGRLGASTFSKLESNAACQVNVYSEGRGSYSGLESGGSIPSLGGNLLESQGPESFIESLTGQGTGLFLDTRVLFDYRGQWPSRLERFSSDLLEPEKIDTRYLRKLTEAALNSEKPVVLGGHSIISGALYLLSDVAWEFSRPKSINVRPRNYKI